MHSRDVLPIPDIPAPGLTTYDAKDPDTRYPPITPLLPPQGAPNVLLVLIDDVGFGASSAFGGPCQTPNFERLAKQGLKYTRFHTTALCSPTRSALLTGRNHHSVGMGNITELATSAPGNNSIWPNTCAPLARTLNLNGYSTAQFGKCHEVPVWETSPMGPYRQWPTGMGFDYFYGFLGGETNQWYPALYEGTTPVEPWGTPEDGYYLNDDLSAHAIKWMRQQKALMPDRPFFAYYAPGATHAPHHVPKDWADKYHGVFDDGWDALRERTFARQKELGVIPADAELTERSPGIPAWDDIADELKPVLARQMEVYAGFLENTDHHIGELLDALEDLHILEDTMVITIIGDNGASAEGSLQGTFNEMITLGGFAALETADVMAAKIDQFGGPEAYNHYAVGWAHAMDTPYQWTKQVASHFGGTRNGTIVHWPHGFSASGETRDQFHHVIDIAPTVLEAAGLPHPTFVNGVMQKPIEGVAMNYSFDDASAPERHETQYFEMFGNRGIYHKGWTAVTKHRTPWETGAHELPAFDDDVWELYDTRSDWTQARDVAAEFPDKLHDLQRLWLIEAVKYNVVPLDDRFVERGLPESAGRPTLVHGKRQLLFGGMGRLTENSVLMMKNTSFSLTAQVKVPEGGAEGVIVAQGGVSGGQSLYLKDGKPKYTYNFFGLDEYSVAASEAVPPGDHQVRMEFTYDGGGVGKGGEATLYIDGNAVGSGHIERTEAFLFSADETCDVGNEFGSPVTTDYSQREFSGEVEWVEIDLGLDDHNHLIRPEDRVNLAMALQ
ncbi:sulfatase-like hydrolase/transferase [Solirubrobacter phytolaccae]|uniref:Sulfatase-like hydrolase/transferase n=1 Tax=Solirubrobacter phytolaccae TaxID=1404360 RepID=A0A9X3NBP2_9ACTN|nr:arylsulfatase [Solirubrobacter phytolaccae]MDA0183428.1 sulfatase-like hydrolase/transferase [Solirubrobacter phytolaccae]